ncbi:GNAT family N-acetyltransferase [Glycomyces artemisiae]|uniref:Ribosomal protein S18 acetylase RimI-like enzyme n=1 Tax=Glycomyces artemisiae TaxID=1076443 RepID=A0A2T0UVA2_9ACTN|nr:GNAT family N-acetyltransferase [Glycomyces artemisiae]PRY61834.1 ribosomal protein S18 acetylase RimI-like enzyme [Glycomyces artemisiae]
MLGPEHVGRRVVVRVGLADPAPGRRYRDVTGELVAAGDVWRVRTRTGDVDVSPGTVVAARVVPPKPVPFSEIVATERLLAQTWPATETAALGGWLLRAASGFTNRANSVLALTAPEGGVDAAVAAVVDWYEARGLVPKFSMAGPVTRRLDDELAARGWTYEMETVVMVKALKDTRYDGEAVVTDAPSAAFLAQTDRGAASTAPRVFGSGLGRAYAEIWRDGALAARGRGAVAGDLLAVTSIGTVPEYRRRGLGTEILAALEAWGAEADAARAALQVEADNAPAIAMYERLGYAERYRYGYRVMP